jgi:hypothetical protein
MSINSPGAPALPNGRVFRSLRKSDAAGLGTTLSTEAIGDMVAAYAEPLVSTSRPRATAGVPSPSWC